jgi:hypothetical protein
MPSRSRKILNPCTKRYVIKGSRALKNCSELKKSRSRSLSRSRSRNLSGNRRSRSRSASRNRSRSRSPKRSRSRSVSRTRRSRSRSPKRRGRRSPEDSATKFRDGFVLYGNDGNGWKVKRTSNGVKRWVRTTLDY